jgi:DNA-binding CsgD family transcriptional regulator
MCRHLLAGEFEAALATGQAMAAHGDQWGSPVTARRQASLLTFRSLLYVGRARDALDARPEGTQQADRDDWDEDSFSKEERALCLAHLGRFDEALPDLHAALRRLDLTDGDDDRPLRLLTLVLETAVLLGERDAASRLAPKLVALDGEPNYLTGVALQVGRAYALLGDTEAASTHYERALQWANAIRFRPEIALTRLALAELVLGNNASVSGRPRGEAKTAGARDDQDNGRGSVAVALDHLAYATEELRAMGMAPALERALALQKASGVAPPRMLDSRAGPLTEREMEVLQLLTEGSSSPQIAEQLGLSVRTVERHVSNIYVKLDVRTRAQATAYALTRGLVTPQ